MLYVRALLLRNCGRFTHISSDFGSQYYTHTFVTSEALYASLTREVTWLHASRFVDLAEDITKSVGEDYFFRDYDVKAKPLWFTPGMFVDEQLRLLPKQRGVVDKNDFNVVDEGYPGTGGGGRAYYCPTYGRIESVLPGHRLWTCVLSPMVSELECFTVGQTFIMGKKRTMFQLMDVSSITNLIETSDGGVYNRDEYQPIQVAIEQVRHFCEYEILAGTARYLLLRGRTLNPSLCAQFTGMNEIMTIRRILPVFWVEQVQQRLLA